ncbi:MAG: pyridoxal phosphate-dependent aminotransferase family protein [Bacteroidota bacterium]|nr:pyridoxal phosphate-dependent aminotransferase family protein [Bacteroidota bacterium]
MLSYKYIIDSAAGTQTRINGENYLYFAGTGYFQLNSHPELIKAASEATLKFGIASATSRAISGTTPLLLEIEKKTAEFFDTEDAAYLPSGYLSNIAGLKALSDMDLFDVIFIDEESHYCLTEGAMTVGLPIVSVKNRSIDDLKIKLEQTLKPGQRPLIASDGLFPVWAKSAPLNAYLKLADQYNGVIWIDDAHAVGILGKNGRGSYEHAGLKSHRLYMGATLSKAFGAYGGIIPGNTDFISRIKSGSVMTGSNAPMHAAVAAGIKGLELVKNNPQMREKLWENARYLKEGLKAIGIETDDNSMPVVAFAPGNVETMTSIHKALMDEGIYIQFAKYRGSGDDGVLRIVVFSTHTKDQIDYLTNKLGALLIALKCT